MPPQAKSKIPAGTEVPKVEVEKSDLADQPPKTSSALPDDMAVTDGIDEAATVDTVMIDHPTYGRISLADLEEVIAADTKAKLEHEAAERQAEEDAKLPELCEEHFPEGWESRNAVDQDGVGCEHGSWSRKRVKE